MSLALWFIYIWVSLGFVGILIDLGEKTFIVAKRAVVVSVFINLITIWAVYSLWQSSGFEARTSIAILLWTIVAIFIVQSMSLAGKTINYTNRRGIFATIANIGLAVGASLLAFG